jgi:hypothetical protein
MRQRKKGRRDKQKNNISKHEGKKSFKKGRNFEEKHILQEIIA